MSWAKFYWVFRANTPSLRAKESHYKHKQTSVAYKHKRKRQLKWRDQSIFFIETSMKERHHIFDQSLILRERYCFEGKKIWKKKCTTSSTVFLFFFCQQKPTVVIESSLMRRNNEAAALLPVPIKLNPKKTIKYPDSWFDYCTEWWTTNSQITIHIHTHTHTHTQDTQEKQANTHRWIYVYREAVSFIFFTDAVVTWMDEK